MRRAAQPAARGLHFCVRLYEGKEPGSDVTAELIVESWAEVLHNLYSADVGPKASIIAMRPGAPPLESSAVVMSWAAKLEQVRETKSALGRAVSAWSPTYFPQEATAPFLVQVFDGTKPTAALKHE